MDNGSPIRFTGINNKQFYIVQCQSFWESRLMIIHDRHDRISFEDQFEEPRGTAELFPTPNRCIKETTTPASCQPNKRKSNRFLY